MAALGALRQGGVPFCCDQEAERRVEDGTGDPAYAGMTVVQAHCVSRAAGERSTSAGAGALLSGDAAPGGSLNSSSVAHLFGLI